MQKHKVKPDNFHSKSPFCTAVEALSMNIQLCSMYVWLYMTETHAEETSHHEHRDIEQIDSVQVVNQFLFRIGH